jgi:hypothetical protein
VVAKRCWDGWFGQSDVIGSRRSFRGEEVVGLGAVFLLCCYWLVSMLS